MMVGSFVRLAAAALLCAALAGCASSPVYERREATLPQPHSSGNRSEAESPLQCVPYARDESGVAIRGDAYTWWAKAEGRYARAAVPSRGAVMVLYNYAGAARAHVAVVRKIVNTREIRINHANWLDDGAIYTDDPVRDVSAANDWSQVRVYNIPAHAWGTRIYPVQGFIGPGPATGDDVLVAQNRRKADPDDPIARLLAEASAEQKPAHPSRPVEMATAPATDPIAGLMADDLADEN